MTRNREVALVTVTRLLDELALIEMKVEFQPEHVGVWRAQLGQWKADGVRDLYDDYSPEAAEFLRVSCGRGDPDLVKVARSELRRYREVLLGLQGHLEDYGVVTSETARLLHPQVRKRRARVKSLWLYGLSDREIGESLWVDVSTVKRDRKALGLRTQK